MAWLMHPSGKIGIFVPDPVIEKPAPSEKKEPAPSEKKEPAPEKKPTKKKSK